MQCLRIRAGSSGRSGRSAGRKCCDTIIASSLGLWATPNILTSEEDPVAKYMQATDSCESSMHASSACLYDTVKVTNSY